MYQVENAKWPCGHTHPELLSLGGAARNLAGTQPPPPGVCCQLTEDGLTVACSDGMMYNSACPKCPAPNTPGYAKYQQVGNQLIPIPPDPGLCAGAPGGVLPGISAPQASGNLFSGVIALGVLGAVGYGVYTLIRK